MSSIKTERKVVVFVYIGNVKYKDRKDVKVLVLIGPSCLILCDPMVCCPPGSPVHGIA